MPFEAVVLCLMKTAEVFSKRCINICSYRHCQQLSRIGNPVAEAEFSGIQAKQLPRRAGIQKRCYAVFW